MQKGFTLIEIMIIIAIIGLLAAVAIPLFMRAQEKNEENATTTNSVTQVEESEDI